MMNGCARHFREKMDLRPAFPPCPHPHPVPLGPPFPHSSFPPLSYRSSLEGWHFQLNRTRDHHYGNSRPCSPCETSWEVGGGRSLQGAASPHSVYSIWRALGLWGSSRLSDSSLGKGWSLLLALLLLVLSCFFSPSPQQINTLKKEKERRKRKCLFPTAA